MTKSIMQSEKICYLSGRTDWLEKHHLYQGANRKLSEKYGLWVYLNHYWHNEPPNGVHFNKENMERLHKEGQRAFEMIHGTREDFVRIFGRSWL